MVFAGLPGDLCAGINGVLLCGTMGYFRRNIYIVENEDDFAELTVSLKKELLSIINTLRRALIYQLFYTMYLVELDRTC